MLRLLPLFTLLLLGCSKPCEKLLDKVCACKGDRAKSACEEARKRRAARDKEQLDEEKCKKQIETFQCDHLP